MLTITLGTETFDLATTLRVAYLVQGQNNHRSYIELFQDIDKMTLEQQIGIIYASFKAANPEKAKFLTLQNFTDQFMDQYNLSQLMELIRQIIEGITGKTDSDEESASFLAGTNSLD